MAIIDQARDILEGAAGHPLTNDRLLEYVQNYLQLDPATNTTSNTDMAAAFVSDVRRRLRNRIKVGAMNVKLAQQQATVTQAGEDSVGDF